MNFISIFFCFFTLINCNSAVGKKQQHFWQGRSEVVELLLEHYQGIDTTLKHPFWVFRDKIWFCDSLAIEEVRYLSMLDSANIKTEEYKIRCYRFSDLRKDVFYEFRNFSDTASLIGAYSYKDTLPQWGGWMFRRNSHIEYEGQANDIPDTLIGGVHYKRLKTMSFRKNIPYVTECYFRCDQAGTNFNIDTALTRKTGCPLTKTFSYPPVPTKSALRLNFEIRFLSDALTRDEQKVFKAWEKFVDEHPVRRKG